jgi:hypothetical protein
MDNVLVILILALAAGYVIRRFFFKKGNACGCGCSGGDCGGSGTGKGASCCGDAAKRP